MRFENVPVLEGYKIREKIADRSDKTIYLVMGEDGVLRVLKVFQKNYKYPVYENLARLTHINMPQIYGTFLMEDCFYVLEEFIEGWTIQEILETGGALGINPTIDIILQLCDVLMYLHNQIPPIIHRDITPANIMLTNDGVIKLLDFDIAREHKKEAAKDTEVFGTKPFAPPEQYGFAQSDHRADIYSLGMLMTFMLTNTYDPKRIKSFRLKAVVKGCTAFDPKKRYEDAKTLKNRIRLCVPPGMLLSSLANMDTNIYVFPNSRLRIWRVVIPVIALYFSIIALAFIQPQPPPPNSTTRYSLLLFTIIINPQWTASDAQYKVFFIIIFALLFTFAAFIVFALYDVVMFYCLRGLQKYYLKQDTSRRLSTIPFVIASKKYVHCTAAFAASILIILSIPYTDVWIEYDIHGSTMLAVILCCLLSFALRSAHYPKCYNSAVRCYYKGDVKKAVQLAKKSVSAKVNPARIWFAEILRMEDKKNLP